MEDMRRRKKKNIKQQKTNKNNVREPKASEWYILRAGDAEERTKRIVSNTRTRNTFLRAEK